MPVSCTDFDVNTQTLNDNYQPRQGGSWVREKVYIECLSCMATKSTVIEVQKSPYLSFESIQDEIRARAKTWSQTWVQKHRQPTINYFFKDIY